MSQHEVLRARRLLLNYSCASNPLSHTLSSPNHLHAEECGAYCITGIRRSNPRTSRPEGVTVYDKKSSTDFTEDAHVTNEFPTFPVSDDFET